MSLLQWMRSWRQAKSSRAVHPSCFSLAGISYGDKVDIAARLFPFANGAGNYVPIGDLGCALELLPRSFGLAFNQESMHIHGVFISENRQRKA